MEPGGQFRVLLPSRGRAWMMIARCWCLQQGDRIGKQHGQLWLLPAGLSSPCGVISPSVIVVVLLLPPPTGTRHCSTRCESSHLSTRSRTPDAWNLCLCFLRASTADRMTVRGFVFYYSR